MSASRHKGTGDHFDLLPFVSILMCTLGCLLFITLSIVSVSLTDIPTILTPVGQKKSPVLIEWANPVSAIHTDGGERIEVRWEPATWKQMETQTPQRDSLGNRGETLLPQALQANLDDISKHSDQKYALIAVRPSGLSTFKYLLTICEQGKMERGYYLVREDERVEATINPEQR